MKPYAVTIKTVLNGWIVKVGCAEVVYTLRSKMLDDLSDYLEDPQAMIKLFKEKSINSELFTGGYVNEEQRVVDYADEAVNIP